MSANGRKTQRAVGPVLDPYADLDDEDEDDAEEEEYYPTRKELAEQNRAVATLRVKNDAGKETTMREYLADRVGLDITTIHKANSTPKSPRRRTRRAG